MKVLFISQVAFLASSVCVIRTRTIQSFTFKRDSARRIFYTYYFSTYRPVTATNLTMSSLLQWVIDYVFTVTASAWPYFPCYIEYLTISSLFQRVLDHIFPVTASTWPYLPCSSEYLIISSLLQRVLYHIFPVTTNTCPCVHYYSESLTLSSLFTAST